MRRSDRRGFTLVELIIVILVLGILAALGMLRYIDLRREGYTTQIAGDIEVVKVAAVTYVGERDAWPATSGQGTAPPELQNLLPASFNFTRPLWTLGWVSTDPQTAGIIIQSSDPAMMNKIRQRFGTKLPFIDGGTYIEYVLSSPSNPF